MFWGGLCVLSWNWILKFPDGALVYYGFQCIYVLQVLFTPHEMNSKTFAMFASIEFHQKGACSADHAGLSLTSAHIQHSSGKDIELECNHCSPRRQHISLVKGKGAK